MSKPKNRPLKRFNGQGTVYKLSGRRRKPWVAAVTKSCALIGDKVKQEREVIGYFEEENKAKTALLMHNAGLIPQKSEMTLKQVYDEWKESKYKYLKKGTTDGYKAAWKRLEVYKNVHFVELRSSHFQDVVDKAHEEKMSRSSLEKVKAVAIMLYGYAMQNDIINKNYAEFINLPTEDKKERKCFSDLDIAKMEKHADKVPYLNAVLILIYTGMRITEMMTLTKFNVDIDNMIITGGIKTDAGKNRVMPIHHKIQKYVRTWYDKNGDTLICDENGKKISSRKFREDLYSAALKAIEVDYLTPHCCRHTLATLLSKANVQTIYIQKIIGHADYSTTANIYTHTDIDQLRSAIESI